jgi:MFS family permease
MAPAAPTTTFGSTGPRNVTVLAATIGALSLGEELWQAYLPAYLTHLGASGLVVGLFGSTRELLDSLYQYPGGRVTERLGQRRALLLFTATAALGYGIYTIAPAWPLVFAGLVAVMAWKAAAFPLTFAVIGDSLPKEQRATAFAVQSILVRLPRVISAPLGGLVISAIGIAVGFRVLCGVTMGIAGMVMVLQLRTFHDPAAEASRGSPSQPGSDQLSAELTHLLSAECLVRFGEGVAASFVVLYVTQVLGFSILEFGTLYAIQQAIAIAAYLPGARLATFTGRRPVVALTFLFFAVFPLAVARATTFGDLVLAFALGGLKEVGEPARKSLIVDLTGDARRASTVGRYYAIRNLLVVPAGLTGGLLWQSAPGLPLQAAGLVGMAGVLVFLVMGVRPRPG